MYSVYYCTTVNHAFLVTSHNDSIKVSPWNIGTGAFQDKVKQK